MSKPLRNSRRFPARTAFYSYTLARLTLLVVVLAARLVARTSEELIVTTIAGKAPWPGEGGEHDRIAPCLASDRDDNVFVCTYRGAASIIWELFAKGGGRAVGVIHSDGRLQLNPAITFSVRLIGEKITFTHDGPLTTQSNGGFGIVDRFVVPQMAVAPPQPIGLAIGGDNALYVSTSPIAADSKGNIYIAGSIVQRINLDGTVTKLAGYGQGSRDGSGPDAQFSRPKGIAVDENGNLLIADTYNGTIRRITADGVVSTVAGMANELGSNDGASGPNTTYESRAHFFMPSGIAITNSGAVIVADTSVSGIRQVLPDGTVSTLCGQRDPGDFNNFHAAWRDGPASSAEFDSPAAIAVSPTGTIFVADTGEHTGRGTIRRIAFGLSQDQDSNPTLTRISQPRSRKITKGRVVTLAHNLGNVGPLLVDASGNIYFGVGADLWQGTVQKLSPNGVITIVAGRSGEYASDERDNAHRFRLPTGLALDRSGTLYVADPQRDDIVEVTSDGNMYRALDKAGAALLPGCGLAFSASGSLYVSRNFAQIVYRVSADGTESDLAGVQGEVGEVDGRGSEARFNNPRLLTVDSHDNVYVSENSTALRRIAPDGTVVTIAGIADQPGRSDGHGTEARFTAITGLAVSADDTVYVCDAGRIRAISPDGWVETVLENHAPAGQFSPDSYDHAPVAVDKVRFADLGSIAIDRAGCLYVADGDSIRKVIPTH